MSLRSQFDPKFLSSLSPRKVTQAEIGTMLDHHTRLYTAMPQARLHVFEQLLLAPLLFCSQVPMDSDLEYIRHMQQTRADLQIILERFADAFDSHETKSAISNK